MEGRTEGGPEPPPPEAPVGLPVEAPEWPPYCDPTYVMPSTIQVALGTAQGDTIRIPVAIEKAVPLKTYLGGYRHKKTGQRYHHATTQTPAGLDRRNGWADGDRERKAHRDTQTYETKTRSQMTVREYGTQMKRNDLLMDDSDDREKIARPYFSSSQLDELKRKKTLIIQCYWRGYVARKRTWNIREALYQDFIAEREALVKAAAAEEKRRQFEIDRRMNPKSTRDFELLYNELEAWVQKEVKEMNSTQLSDIERKEKMAGILAKQTKALQTIDKLKVEASKLGKEKRVARMLDLMAKPKLWEMGTGEVQEVHTQFTVRAAELMDLYKVLTDYRVSLDERLDVLLNVKWTVREFDCKLSRDIVELCDREAEMLNRGRSVGTLGGLRQRLANLFLQFIETPDFNPEATRFLKVPPVGGDGRRLLSTTM